MPALVTGCASPAARATSPQARQAPPVTRAVVLEAAGQRPAVQKKRTSLIRLRRQGGFVGADDRVTIYTDGCAVVKHRTGPAREPCLAAHDIRALRGDLGRLRLGRSQPEPPGADMYKHTLTYHGRSVVRYTLPPTWSPVVRRLEKLLSL
ncbi:hypothetical protein AB0M95_29715 [Sphaerisporangium sp. NPDC051017]|uniref:hypothetical protein n=1 Tax=Sphaerisporangium sp. NPDC051017 TaxID=3154636 RepID=UPI0034310438